MSVNHIQTACQILQRGGLVAFPTETVYGLGADAKNPQALSKIFQAKERPLNHPVIVHLATVNELQDWAIEIPDEAYQLAAAFWPGPLTLLLKKAPWVLDAVTGGQALIGLRIPHHPLALELLRAFGSGIAAPSANRFGRISPTTAHAVQTELGNKVDYILDGGQCQVGIESTIIDLSQGSLQILRPGMLTQDDITRVLQRTITMPRQTTVRVSGALASHYAPQTPAYLLSHAEIVTRMQQSAALMGSIGIVLRQPLSHAVAGVECVCMPHDPESYAYQLYETLRQLDQAGFNQLWIEAPPEDAAWVAIRDRLQRACKCRPL